MSTTDTARPISTAVDGYFAMWNESDPQRRREVIAATWAQDAGYIDPMFAADGPEALDALVAAGVDFAVLAADGRLRQVTGFFEPPAGS